MLHDSGVAAKARIRSAAKGTHEQAIGCTTQVATAISYKSRLIVLIVLIL